MMQKDAGRCRVHGRAPQFNDWKALFVGPAVNGYLFSNKKKIRQRKERDAPPFISCAQDTVGL